MMVNGERMVTWNANGVEDEDADLEEEGEEKEEKVERGVVLEGVVHCPHPAHVPTRGPQHENQHPKHHVRT